MIVLRLADRIAAHLDDPAQVARRHRPDRCWRQSLASGALGIALLHVERARTDRAPWTTAHAWLRYAATGPVDDGPGSHLHYGAPALAMVLHHAADHDPRRYGRALDALDARIAPTTTARVQHAHRRIDTGQTPALAEFDAIRGLTGLGAYWHRRDPHGPALRAVLAYLVRLTEALPDGRPGWWTHLAPDGRRSPQFADGHANNGLAHGIAGPLALLALTHRRGVAVPGHAAAIRAHPRLVRPAPTRRRPRPVVALLDHAQPRPSDPAGSTVLVLRHDRYRPCPAARRTRPRRHHPHPGRRGDPARHAHRTRAGPAARRRGPVPRHRRCPADRPPGRRRRADHPLGAALVTLQQQTENDPRTTVATHPGAAADLLGGAAGIALALDDRTLTGPGWDTCLFTS